MTEMDINNAEISDLTNAVTDVTVDTQSTDGVGDQKETYWTFDDWTKWLGYYKEIPELRAAIDAKARWAIGKGLTADPETETTLNFIRGWGKETINVIIENMIRTYYIGGDSFAEKIFDIDDNLVNLKTLSPETIRVVLNRKGIIIRYEQITRGKFKSQGRKIDVENMLHLSRNRIADEIHGISIIESLETLILSLKEARQDYKQVMHRFVKPRFIIKLDTDNAVKIKAFKAKMDKANQNGENIYAPMGTIEIEAMTIAPNATLNPLAWIASLTNTFYEACGTPKIIMGNSDEFTGKAAAIVYLAFQQSVEEEQLYIEEQFVDQLGLYIELEFPVSIENELLSQKDGSENNANIDANDTTAEVEGEE